MLYRSSYLHWLCTVDEITFWQDFQGCQQNKFRNSTYLIENWTNSSTNSHTLTARFGQDHRAAIKCIVYLTWSSGSKIIQQKKPQNIQINHNSKYSILWELKTQKTFNSYNQKRSSCVKACNNQKQNNTAQTKSHRMKINCM